MVDKLVAEFGCPCLGDVNDETGLICLFEVCRVLKGRIYTEFIRIGHHIDECDAIFWVLCKTDANTAVEELTAEFGDLCFEGGDNETGRICFAVV